MLDKIQNTGSESITQSQNLDRIRGLGTTNPFEDDDKGFFVDESRISSQALEKYQRELDVKKFSDILMETDEQAANELVLQQAFDGTISIDNDDFLSELLNNEDFINEIAL